MKVWVTKVQSRSRHERRWSPPTVATSAEGAPPLLTLLFSTSNMALLSISPNLPS